MRRFRKRLLIFCGLLVVTYVVHRVWTTGRPVGKEHLKTLENASTQTGEPAWEQCFERLRMAEKALETINDTSATFYKQERLGGKLERITELRVKQRRSPESVYLRWNQPHDGREAIFVDGENGGLVIAHEGGFLRRITPDVRFRLESSFSRKFSNHPLNALGFDKLRARVLKTITTARKSQKAKVTLKLDVQLRNRPSDHFVLVHNKDELAKYDYSRLEVFFDQGHKLITRWELYGWAVDSGAPQLLEYFEFADAEINVGLDDIDFSVSNPDYGFSKR